jgi:hypothetical protein
VAAQGFCNGDNECNSWEFCEPKTHLCEPEKGRCGADSDCGTWQVCTSGHDCNAKLGFCDDDSDCVSGEVCNQKTHLCQ